MTIKLRSIDEGFCRVNYICEDAKGRTCHLCLQKGPEVTLFSSCESTEPSYEIQFESLIFYKKGVTASDLFERPKPDSELTKAVNKWIDTH